MRVVPTTQNGILTRAIASTDCRGAGTYHPISAINPFVVLENAPVITSPNVPPFGLHPHSGIMVVTICLSGQVEYVHIDGNGNKVVEVQGPGPFLSAVNAGRGAVHDEHTYTADPCKLIQCAWMSGEDNTSAELTYVPKPTVLCQDDQTKIMLCVGSFRGSDSGIRPPNPTTLLHITLPSGGKFQTEYEGNAFVYNMEGAGAVLVNQEKVPPSHIADMEENKGYLDISNDSPDTATLLVGYGAPITPEWTKLLMFNGFIYAASVEDAEKKEEEFRERGIHGFGRGSTG
eukprot:CAMPEP_0181288424 /NCGR_PEP_ID=MMETSP1101-20121128/325_1 /TAXON_ID=46948 /ORGANISM="Rhodomonas abbreviata, Strain Caron Lab Isolate" /LENGTH=287 /DNA_ID=CAMNT_0023392545 /DNA_START=82 /DNA_END=945 /DNA_ORIENTATION=-